MKKFIVALVIMLLSTSVIAYAEPIDESYFDLIFNKFNSFEEDDKAQMVDLLNTLITSDIGLDVLYLEVIKQEAAMANYGITAEDLKVNIDALKSWSVEDRLALVEAGLAGDKDKISELNDKQTAVKAVVTDSVRKALITKEISIKPYAQNKTFGDVEKHWSKDYVYYLVKRGIVSGKSENSYDPEASITKAEIVTMITKMLIEDMSNVPSYEGTAKDITSGQWYDAHMQRGVSLGLISADSKNELSPMVNSTREEVVEILINSLNSLEITIPDELKVYKGDFKDFDQISPERQEAMIIAINLGFISGKGDGIIDPKSEIKRSEIAVVVNKLYTYILEEINQ